jgi:phosphoribosylaminoimidazole (AIR) synthetase
MIIHIFCDVVGKDDWKIRAYHAVTTACQAMQDDDGIRPRYLIYYIALGDIAEHTIEEIHLGIPKVKETYGLELLGGNGIQHLEAIASGYVILTVTVLADDGGESQY